jgi:glycosyltransferase involved in cell wall biosynthesis
MSVSVLILTYNEEKIIKECIESVQSISDDIIIFDSYSTDNTVVIARELGVRVYQRVFDNEKLHRSESLKLNFKYDWVYNPDADEITPKNLADEILERVSDNDSCNAYDVGFRVMFYGKWIKYSSLYPTYVVRLFKPDKLSFDREINLTYNVDGNIGRLDSYFLHYTFNKGLEFWFEKHNKYSTFEAIETIKSLRNDKLEVSSLFAKNSTTRRRALKQLSFRLPARPLFRFLYMYFLKRGLLDGRAGFDYCLMMAIYEYMITSKVKERGGRL